MLTNGQALDVVGEVSVAICDFVDLQSVYLCGFIHLYRAGGALWNLS